MYVWLKLMMVLAAVAKTVIYFNEISKALKLIYKQILNYSWIIDTSSFRKRFRQFTVTQQPTKSEKVRCTCSNTKAPAHFRTVFNGYLCENLSFINMSMSLWRAKVDISILCISLEITALAWIETFFTTMHALLRLSFFYHNTLHASIYSLYDHNALHTELSHTL